MTSDPHSDFPLALDHLYELLEVDRDVPVRKLLHAARRVRGVTAPLVLSLAALEGEAMGSGARDELARMTRRAETYRRLAEEAARVPGARVVKGPSLARHYPEGVLRPLGDLDVVVGTEAALWQVLAPVLDRYECHEAELTELTAHGRDHLYAGVWWLGEDPMLDADHAVEVTTFGFAGEPGAVPLRVELPDDPMHADLLSLAEERFQRPFTAKDAIDLVCALTSPAAPAPGPLVAAAERFALAPELLELCDLVRARPLLADVVPAGLVDGLRSAAAEERARRAGAARRAPLPVDGRLHGLQLTEPLRRGAGHHRTVHRWNDGVITRSPVSDFLMVPGEVVEPRLYESALAELAGLPPWPQRPAVTTAPHHSGREDRGPWPSSR
ncbi:hypothetical protein ACFQ6N_04600 [Kitasatospora sp. NPDC056446]|uniref:hypothetical protein n=1 Tax=Kitasatospora sp. NPDC056446 TaxID=3345819 RepID=UPI0036B62DBC